MSPSSSSTNLRCFGTSVRLAVRQLDRARPGESASSDTPAILNIGHPLLRASAAPVLKQDFGSPRLLQLVRDMNSVMDRHDALGLSAPQLGVPLQVCAYQYLESWMTDATRDDDARRGVRPAPRTFLINPKIKLIGGDRTVDFEGCLSVDNLCALVKRARVIEVTARDLNDKPLQFRSANGTEKRWRVAPRLGYINRAEDYIARVIQHEIDHLRGVLFVDRMFPRSLRTIDQIDAELPDAWDKTLDV